MHASVLLRVPLAGRSTIDRVWPEPPDILDVTLFVKTAEAHEARALGRPLVGREVEMAALMRFAGPAAGKGPHWTTLWGLEGVGKTKLALEWLARLKALGWDVGTIRLVSPPEIEQGHFRRNTAIVVDEAGLHNASDLWEALAQLMARNGRIIRVLLLDNLPLDRPHNLTAADRSRLDATHWREGGSGALSPLSPLTDGALAQIAPEAEVSIRDQAAGRPRYVLLGTDPNATIAALVERRLAAADGDAGLARLLAFAALAGPAPNAIWPKALGVDPGVRRLRRLFGGVGPDAFRDVLPPLEPEPVSSGVLTAWAADQLPQSRDALLDLALETNPNAAERRLALLWSRRLAGRAAEARADFQARFDARAPERVEALLRLARETTALLGSLLEMLEKPESSEQLRAAEARLVDAVCARPFDVRLAYLVSDCAVRATFRYGAVKRFEDVERWSERLSAAVAARPDDPLVRLHEAMGAVNAIGSYGGAKRFEDLERWGDRLIAIAAAPPDDPALRLHEAMGAVSAIYQYGAAEHFEDLERWGDRLIAIAAAPPNDPALRLEEIKGAVNAISSYGRAKRFKDLERWGKRGTVRNSVCGRA